MVNLRLTGIKVKVKCNIKKIHIMKDHGQRVKNQGKVNMSWKVEISTLVTSKMEKQRVQVFILIKMVLNMRDNFLMDLNREEEPINLKIKTFTQENGIKIKCMVKGYLFPKNIKANITVNLRKVNTMAQEYMNSNMAKILQNMLDHLKTEYFMMVPQI